jgi:hypothetical protein
MQNRELGPYSQDLAHKAVSEYGLCTAVGPVSVGTLASGGGDDMPLMMRDAGAGWSVRLCVCLSVLRHRRWACRVSGRFGSPSAAGGFGANQQILGMMSRGSSTAEITTRRIGFASFAGFAGPHSQCRTAVTRRCSTHASSFRFKP